MMSSEKGKTKQFNNILKLGLTVCLTLCSIVKFILNVHIGNTCIDTDLCNFIFCKYELC